MKKHHILKGSEDKKVAKSSSFFDDGDRRKTRGRPPLASSFNDSQEHQEAEINDSEAFDPESIEAMLRSSALEARSAFDKSHSRVAATEMNNRSAEPAGDEFAADIKPVGAQPKRRPRPISEKNKDNTTSSKAPAEPENVVDNSRDLHDDQPPSREETTATRTKLKQKRERPHVVVYRQNGRDIIVCVPRMRKAGSTATHSEVASNSSSALRGPTQHGGSSFGWSQGDWGSPQTKHKPNQSKTKYNHV